MVSLEVLDYSEDASDPDQNTCGVEGNHVCLPSDLRVARLGCWTEGHTAVENATNNDKTTEEEELYEKTADDQLLSGLQVFWTT